MSLLPTSSRSRFLRVVAWLNLAANLLIIATGGAVRLTGSGLGCDEWPGCTSTSFLPGVDEGVHGLIEFGNRTLSGVLLALAVLAVVAVWRLRRSRRDLWVHAGILLIGVVAQAVIGLVVVVTRLETSTVGIHYLLSAALVGVAAGFVLRVHRDGGPRRRDVPGWMAALVHFASLLLVAVVVVGVLTTGSGPHSGDAEVIRDSSAWAQYAHAHAWLGYALVVVLAALLVAALALRRIRLLRAGAAVLLVVGVQIAVGVAQANLGIPPLLVGVHMVLAAVTIALTVVLQDATRVAAASAAEPRTPVTSGASS